jgi:DNA polymerase
LHESRIQAVFGEGPWDAPIFIVGEGPGAAEDEAGRPFVGRAGKLLDELLSRYGLSRNENVFIGNVVKCRPPKNRIPSRKEVKTCFPYLEKQIALINPRIIVLLGSTALKSFYDPGDKITLSRGQWKEDRGRLIMPTYHPAAIFRNPSYKTFIESDLKTVAEKYEELF